MALVKTSKIAGAKAQEPTPAPLARTPARPRRDAVGRDKVSERVAAATEELASGLSEASAAAEELRRSMEQIAAGSEEAAGASTEQLAAIKDVAASLTTARAQAELSRRRTETVQLVLAETAVQITASVRAIERGAERQAASLEVILELERRAREIGEITRTVSRISDQTNLLALNAAIEAARAGDHGRGFAVVAEEVRALAETSEKSAQDVQGLAAAIQTDVQDVVVVLKAAADTAVSEARAGLAVVDSLDAARRDVAGLAQASDATLMAALEIERATVEAQRGAELVASAAEEQSSAAAEAQVAVRQQAQSLDQGQLAAQALASLTEDLRSGVAKERESEQIAATAEELSATIQELSSAASQILAAVEQINRGSQQQAAAAQQSATALAQIEDAAAATHQTATRSSAGVEALAGALADGRGTVEKLMAGVSDALDRTRGSLTAIQRLETAGRRIDRIVGGIDTVAVQITMLAVSGSVEAARAGESGRGFAVVSGDIRALAREASASVEAVKDTVQGILDQIAALRRELEQVVGAGDSEVQTNRAIFAALERLNGDVAALGEANTAILDGAGAISVAAGEMSAAARQIAAAADQASAASRQAATAASQQARGAEDLAAAIEEIASLADELKA